MRNDFAMCRNSIFGLILLFVLCSGCNEEPITNVYLSDDPDTFTLVGRVVSFPEKTPVPEAEYTILAGNLTGICDQNGLFEVAGLSPGNYQVVVSSPEYATSRVTMTLTAPSKKTNINQYRNFFLLENSCDLDLTVRGQDTGEVLSGVTVEVISAVFPNWLYGHEIDLQSLPSGGQTDENGQISLAGLPATALLITARAHDADGDEKIDYGTVVSEFRLVSGETRTGHLAMAPYTGEAPSVVATNLPEGYAPAVISPSIYFIFSVPMQTSSGSTKVSLVQDNNPYQEIPMTATWTSPIRLELTPLEPLTTLNMDYNFSLVAFSEDGQPYSTYRNSMYWQTGDDPVGGDCEEVVTDLVAENATGGEIDFNTQAILLTWTAVSCSGGYRIYAHDDRNNTQWIFLKDEPTDYETGTITTICSLPSSFDRYDVDGIQTPFAGTEITFCVVPKRAMISNPGDPHGVVVANDDRAPLLTWVSQIGNGINDTGSMKYLEFGVLFSEYINPSVADPVIEVTEAGGDPAYTLDTASASWVWNGGRFSGQFVFEIPDGANASGDNIRVTVNDLADLSDNTTAGLSASDWQMVEVWGSIYDFETSPQGWTQTGEGWQWGTPTIGPVGAHESQRCWGLSMDTNYGPNWTTDLRSPEFMVPGVNPVLTFWGWYETDYYDDYVRVYADDGINEVQLDSFHGNSSGWVLNSYDLSDFLDKKIILRFRFTSDSYGEYSGFFLDDVVIDSAGN